MVDIDKAVFARLNKKGKEFEILVDPDLAQKAKEDLKQGKDVDVSRILAIEDIFFDSKKGIRAGKKDFMPAFDTADILEIAKIILKEGKIYTTGGQRDKERKDKWDRIVALISMNAIDAKTKMPIPSKSIEDALHKAMFRLDERKVDDQFPDAVKAVKKIIPMTFEEKKIQLKNLAPNVAGRCLDVCKKLGTITRQEWGNDQSLTLTLSIPAGLNEEFTDKINAITHGNVDMKYIV